MPPKECNANCRFFLTSKDSQLDHYYMPVRSAIHKTGHRPHVAARKDRTARQSLVGRRVQVPQELYFANEPGDDEPFHFGGTVKEARARQLLILFDYTGEEEWHARCVASRWLMKDVAGPLSELLERLSSTGRESQE